MSNETKGCARSLQRLVMRRMPYCCISGKWVYGIDYKNENGTWHSVLTEKRGRALYSAKDCAKKMREMRESHNEKVSDGGETNGR